MKRYFVPGLCLLLALTGCSALPYAYEIDQTVLMGALGVDAGVDADLVLTAASAGRSGAGESPGQEAVVLSAEAEALSAARSQMQTYGERSVFYGDIEQVLVGEGAARQGLEDLLGQMAGPELRLESNLWVVRGGSAADPLFDAAQEGGAPGRLSALEQDAELLGAPLAKTAREALAELLDNGCTLLPALERQEAEEGQGTQGDYVLVEAGYAVFREGALRGFTQGEETLGTSLLLGKGHGKLLAFSEPEWGTVTLRLTGVKAGVEPQVSDGGLEGVTITCRLEAQVTEFRGWGGHLPEEERLDLEENLARRGERALRAALDLYQGLGADCLRLGGRAALAAPWHKKILEEQWAAAFPELEMTLEVEAQVARG